MKEETAEMSAVGGDAREQRVLPPHVQGASLLLQTALNLLVTFNICLAGDGDYFASWTELQGIQLLNTLNVTLYPP